MTIATGNAALAADVAAIRAVAASASIAASVASANAATALASAEALRAVVAAFSALLFGPGGNPTLDFSDPNNTGLYFFF